MRGIGFTLINFLNNLPVPFVQDNMFVFYVLPKGEALFGDPFELLSVGDMRYEVRNLKKPKHIPRILPGRLNIPFGAFNRLLRFHSFYFGDSRVASADDVDVFLQADQNHAFPRGRFKKVLIIYDIIPQMLEWDYLVSYRTARMRGDTRKKSAVLQFKRHLLINKTRRNTKRAHKLVSISEHTKKDFVEFLGVHARKVSVVPLGVTMPDDNTAQPALEQYISSGWGYLKRPLKLDPKVPFLLFVGGVDSRRKLEDLVTAFNNLRAQGKDLKLILVGDIMLGPSAITNPYVSRTLKQSSYLDDIVFMGFASDEAKAWLYSNALSFVFPSRYEGFGLPVLEAMVRNCPVISYRSDAVREVAGDTPLYADDMDGLMNRITELMEYSEPELSVLRQKGATMAKKYNWAKTSASIAEILYNFK